jgi:hypothetical protein
LLVIAGLATIVACHASSDSAPPPADTTIPAAATIADSAPDTRPVAQDSVAPLLETGCSGGVTGGGGGTFVTADGRFYRYQRNGPPPNAKRELAFVRRDSAAAAALVESAERAGISRVKYSEPSNMTCHLKLTRGGT